MSLRLHPTRNNPVKKQSLFPQEKGTVFCSISRFLYAIISYVIPATTQERDLEAIAQQYQISLSLALGLGAGLYFEYFRRPLVSPTHSFTGLARDIESACAARVVWFREDPQQALRDALRENALRFNL